jgi:IclR family transcriptional regulator, mhp operon transcriptional activator
MANVKSIRSLERGINVLKSLHDMGPASLHELHLKTKLSKPTLLRILKTLSETEMVRQGISDMKYRNTIGLRTLSNKLSFQDRVSEATAPVLESLRQKIKWPSDLFMLDQNVGDMMKLIETSRASSPYRLKIDPLGLQVNMTKSAVGRAYLAFSPDKIKNNLFREIKKSKNRYHMQLKDFEKLDLELEEIRKIGVAHREVGFTGGEANEFGFDDELSAMAMAIKNKNTVLGCINIVWRRASHTEEEFRAMYLDDLQQAAKRCELRFAQQ